MNNIIKTVLKVIGWIVIVPLVAVTYSITLLASYRLDEITPWAPLFSLGIVAIYTIGVAVRNKLGGLTLSTFIASVFAFFISVLVYSHTF